MPTPPAHPQGSTYVPPKYCDENERTSRRVLLIAGACAAIIVVGAVIALQMKAPPRQYGAATTTTLVEPPRPDADGSAQQALAKVSPQDSSSSAGAWLGTLLLPELHAVITVRTIADDALEARQFAASYQERASLVSIAIDNAPSTSELVVDTTHSMLQFADGKTVPALDTMKIYRSSRRDASETAARLNSPPYHCPGGQPVVTKMLFIPRGTDTRHLTGITLSVNDQPKTVTGEFAANDGKSAEASK